MEAETFVDLSSLKKRVAYMVSFVSTSRFFLGAVTDTLLLQLTEIKNEISILETAVNPENTKGAKRCDQG